MIAASAPMLPDLACLVATSGWRRWSGLEEPWEVWLVVFGLAGQAIFLMRWVVQWIASERRRASHVPVLFWWCSLVGATMLLTYFVLRRDPVGVVGQATGWLIYVRNLVLIRRSGRAAALEPNG